MKYTNTPTAEILILDLCDQIDTLKTEMEYWKERYEKERDENLRVSNERVQEAKKGVGTALMLALSVTDNPDGSISISKEKRKELAKHFKEKKDGES